MTIKMIIGGAVAIFAIASGVSGFRKVEIGVEENKSVSPVVTTVNFLSGKTAEEKMEFARKEGEKYDERYATSGYDDTSFKEVTVTNHFAEQTEEEQLAFAIHYSENFPISSEKNENVVLMPLGEDSIFHPEKLHNLQVASYQGQAVWSDGLLYARNYFVADSPAVGEKIHIYGTATVSTPLETATEGLFLEIMDMENNQIVVSCSISSLTSPDGLTSYLPFDYVIKPNPSKLYSIRFSPTVSDCTYTVNFILD